MRVSTDKPTLKKVESKKAENTGSAMLATCPTGGGGWCSYPFTAKQLEKRMKAKAKMTEIESMQQQAAAGKKTSKSK
jgi:hypothetical protein